MGRRQKKLISVFSCFLFSWVVNAQRIEFGYLTGFSSGFGDVGREKAFKAGNTTQGLQLKVHRNSRLSYRLNTNLIKFTFDDELSNDQYRLNRKFKSNVNAIEITAGVEFNWYSFNPFNERRKLVPYAYIGLGYARYSERAFVLNDFYRYGDGTLIQAIKPELIVDEDAPDLTIPLQKQIYDTYEAQYKKNSTLLLPIALGMKFHLYRNLNLHLEVGMRMTRVDNLDGGVVIADVPVPDGIDPKDKVYFLGNGQNDYYMLTNFGLSYTFGQKPILINFK
ncbi:MAG: hypothetical protein CMC19_08765 [Flavobacteriaceae bacterium]|nr:hypothetical protein [Flavobacteriaceae bacterium]OUX39256.1 MAG: hypothetical protein CBE25_04585 [Flavobacteriaceae bacterium TMED265]